MRNLQLRFLLSGIALVSIWMVTLGATANAAPVRFEQIQQVINARPGKAATGSFEQLRLVGGDEPVKPGTLVGDDDKTKNGDTPPTPQQTTVQDDGRVITQTTTEIVEDEACDCLQPPLPGKFPYALLGLGAVPLLFLIPHGKRTPTPAPPTTDSPTPTSPTPDSPTPPDTPPPTIPPTPEPVPEPMTILLFGSGLAGVGMAARKKLGRKEEQEIE